MALPTINAGQAGRGIAAASRQFGGSIMSPVLSPIQNSLSVIKNPIQALNLPPGLMAAGSFASGVAGSIGGALGMSKKSPDKVLTDIEDNTEDSASILGKELPKISSLLESIQSIVALLKPTFLADEESGMESPLRPTGGNKRSGGAAKKGGLGNLLEGIDLDAGDVAGGILGGYGTVGLLKMMKNRLFRLGGFLYGGVKTMLSLVVTSMRTGITSLIRNIMLIAKSPLKLLGGIRVAMMPIMRLLGRFVALPLTIIFAAFQFVEGFFDEFFDEEKNKDRSFVRRFIESVEYGMANIIEFFTGGLLDKDKVMEVYRAYNEFVLSIWGSIKEFFKTFDFTKLKDDIFKAFGSLSEKMQEILGPVWKKMEEFLGPVWEKTQEFLGSVWDAIGEFIGGIFDSTKSHFISADPNDKTGWQKLGDALVDVRGIVYDFIMGAVRSMKLYLYEKILKIAQDINENTGGLLGMETIKEWATKGIERNSVPLGAGLAEDSQAAALMSEDRNSSPVVVQSIQSPTHVETYQSTISTGMTSTEPSSTNFESKI